MNKFKEETDIKINEMKQKYELVIKDLQNELEKKIGVQLSEV